MAENKYKSLGERLVRSNFNPSNESHVQAIKERGAELANFINDNVPTELGDADLTSDAIRYKQRSLDLLEDAVSLAVKAITTGL